MELRDVRIFGQPLLDRLYFALRDPDWKTLPLRIDEPVVDRSGGEFQVTIRGTSEGTSAPFVFHIDFVGREDSLEARLRYRAVTDVTINRIGFCLLHPMIFSGSPLDAGSDGVTVHSRFPDRIAPYSPFTDLERLTLRTGDTVVDVVFSGDLFEMEDQRNWIDASYKTFSTPLSQPHPRDIPSGAEARQTITVTWRRDVEVTGHQSAAPSSLPSPSPALRIGLGASRSSIPVRKSDVVRLRQLDLAWLAVTLPLETEWLSRWERAVEEARAIGVPLDVTLVASSRGTIDKWDPGNLSAAEIVRLQAYDPLTHVTTRELAQALHKVRDRRGWQAETSIAGGSRANFAELNRASDTLPLDLLEEVVFAANPQVHAFDTASILQTPDALAIAVRDAIDIAQGRPVVVAPLTVKPIFNAVAADPDRQADLPPDERQHDEVAGEWARRAISAASRAAGLTIYETVGDWGVLDSSGAPSPAYDVLSTPGLSG